MHGTSKPSFFLAKRIGEVAWESESYTNCFARLLPSYPIWALSSAYDNSWTVAIGGWVGFVINFIVNARLL
jgi:hypothetical protein